MKCARTACDATFSPMVHTQSNLRYCVPCARHINAHAPGLVRAQGVIVYGPPMSGKTTNAERLMRHYELDGIVDDWSPGQPVTLNFLHLTTASPEALDPYDDTVFVISIDIALSSMRLSDH